MIRRQLGVVVGVALAVVTTTLPAIATSATLGASVRAAGGDGESSYAAAVRADGPLSYWRLGETAADTTAFDVIGANNGTIDGGVTRGVPGAVADSNGMSFDGGACTGIGLDPAPIEAIDNVTVETWVKMPADGGGIVFRLRWHGFDLHVDRATGKAFAGGYGSDGSYFRVDASGSDLRDGQWHHLALTLGGSRASIYLDGAMVGDSPKEPGIYGGDQAAIARDASACDDVTPSYRGDLDEVALYDHVLSADRIAAHYVTRGGPVTLHTPDLKVVRHIAQLNAATCALDLNAYLGTNYATAAAACTALSLSANPRPPGDLTGDKWSRFVASQEYRGLLHLGPMNYTCDGGAVMVTDTRFEAESNPGLTPVRDPSTGGVQTLGYVRAERYSGTGQGHINDAQPALTYSPDHASFTVTYPLASRLANPDRRAGYLLLGYDAPFIWTVLVVQGSCSGVTARVIGSDVPMMTFYADGRQTKSFAQGYFPGFIWTGGEQWHKPGIGLFDFRCNSRTQTLSGLSQPLSPVKCRQAIPGFRMPMRSR